MGLNKSLHYRIVTIEGRDAQENVMFYPQKRPLTNQIHLEIERNVCVIH